MPACTPLVFGWREGTAKEQQSSRAVFLDRLEPFAACPSSAAGGPSPLPLPPSPRQRAGTPLPPARSGPRVHRAGSAARGHPGTAAPALPLPRGRELRSGPCCTPCCEPTPAPVWQPGEPGRRTHTTKSSAHLTPRTQRLSLRDPLPRRAGVPPPPVLRLWA